MDTPTPARPTRRRTIYSADQKATALAIVAEHGADLGAVTYAAQVTGFPVQTIRDWVHRNREAVEAAAVAVDHQLLPKAWAVRQKALEQVEASLPEAKARDAAVIFGILDDKIGGWSGRREGGANVQVRLAWSDQAFGVEVKTEKG